jgi:LysM repeat protein
VSGRQQLARLAAPAALLLGATVLVLLVRSALDDEPAATTTPATTAPATATDTAATTATTTAAEPEAFYTIESGDTLESIAAAYGTTVEELLRLNPGIDPTNLTVGQRIRVPPS